MSWKAFVLPAAVIAGWSAVSFGEWVSPIFIPKPTDVLGCLVALGASGRLLEDTAATLVRAAVGFGVASVVGVGLGILIGYYERLYEACEFGVDLLRSVPYTALFPLFLLFFGVGNTVKFAVCAWSAWLLIVVDTTYGVQHCNRLRRNAARTFGASDLQILRKIVVFEAAPAIAAGLRLGLSVSIQAAVVVEMFMGTTERGLGQLIYNSAILSKTAEMYASILVAGVVGYAANQVFVAIQARALHWTRG